MSPTEDPAVKKLRVAISRLTGRACMSTDPKYLERRLADLRSRKAGGENVKDIRPGRPASSSSGSIKTVKSFSFTEDQATALAEIARDTGYSESAIARRALYLYAKNAGYPHADVFDGGES